MDNLNCEIKKYLTVCRDIKGLSKLTIKAYEIDFRQFSDFIEPYNCLSEDDLIKYIDFLYKRYKPKSANRKIACIKAFYRY